MATLFATYFVASFHHRRHTPLALPLPAVTPDPLAPLEALKPMGRGNSPTESQLDNACQRTEVVIFFLSWLGSCSAGFSQATGQMFAIPRSHLT